jgi:hypothetical protein
MRLLTCSLVVLCTACGAAPRSTPEVMPEVAAEYGALFNADDEAGMLALFAPARRATGTTPEHLAWLRAQLGECEAPQFMWSFSKRGARFSYPCERGALEVAFILDAAGHITDVSAAAAGIPAPEEVQSAAGAVLASLPWPEATPRPFKHNLDWGVAEALGKCQIVRPWVVHAHGAVFHSDCEHAAALLSVRLHADGTLAYVSLVRSAPVYRGPAVTLPDSRA